MSDNLSVHQAAAFVGCSVPAIYKWVRDGKLDPIPEDRTGPGIYKKKFTFAKPDLEPFRIRWQRGGSDGQLQEPDGRLRVSLRWLARDCGLSYEQLKQWVKGLSGRAAAAAAGVTIPDAQKRERALGGYDPDTLSHAEARALVAAIKKALKGKRRVGYATLDELAQELKAATVYERQELGECLKCWEATQGLKVEVIAQVLVRYVGRNRTETRQLHPRRTWPMKAVKRLWATTCSAQRGAALLRQLVPTGSAKSVPAIKEKMHQAGFMGYRLRAACRAAGLQARPLGFGSGEWVYERAGRGRVSELQNSAASERVSQNGTRPEPLPRTEWDMRESEVRKHTLRTAEACERIEGHLSGMAGRVQTPAPAEQAAAGLAVVLSGRGKCPVVRGVEKKKPLRPAQYDVVQALLNAGEAGLDKDDLDARSGHGDARKILERLAKDADWAAVILMAGEPYGRYRISS